MELARITCAVHLGQVQDAQDRVNRLARNCSPDSPLSAVLAYHEGVVHRAAGDDGAAGEAFHRAVTLSRSALRPNTELHAWLGLLALATGIQDWAAAQTALARAKCLAQTPRDRAFLHWREGSWRVTVGDEASVALLRQALGFFGEREHRREAIWVGLHLAEAQARSGEDSLGSLTRAADGLAALGSPLLLAAELRLTPHVQQVLHRQPQGAYVRVHLLRDVPAPLPHVDLVTLGAAEVRVDDRPVKLRLARTVELVAYLLTVGGASLTDIQRDLFPDTPPAQSKGYFHQARLDLRTRVPGLEIAYDEGQRRYELRVKDVYLTWDAQDLRRALAQPDAFMMKHLERARLEFLQDAESGWAAGERERLRRWVTQVGLETMDGWYRAGQYEKCISLAHRLLPLDPLDEALHEFLVRATLEVRGRAAAWQVCRESLETFRREVDEVPRVIAALEEQLQARALH